MTEIRTTSHVADSLQLLHTIATIIKNINPEIQLRTETFRKSVLIRILFPEKNQAQTFFTTMAEKGIASVQWAEYEIA